MKMVSFLSWSGSEIFPPILPCFFRHFPLSYIYTLSKCFFLQESFENSARNPLFTVDYFTNFPYVGFASACA